MLPFNYHHLYYFYTIARQGSVTGAAGNLRISQSSLSMQLSRFEDFLELKLFHREGKRLRLTEKGHHVFTYAKAIFDLGDELADSLGDRQQTGRLRMQIGVSPSVSKTFLTVLLDFLYTQPEKPYIQLIEKDLEMMSADLELHKLDVIIHDTPWKSAYFKNAHSRLLTRVPVDICACAGFGRRVKKLPQDLNGLPIILPGSQSQITLALKEYFFEHQIKPSIIGEIDDLELIRRLVLEGKAAAPINRLTIQKAPSRNRLQVLGKPGFLGIYEGIYLLHKERQVPHPLVTRLLKDFNLSF